MNRKVIIGATALILLALVVAIASTLVTAGDGTVNLVVAPTNATVSIDGGLPMGAGKLSLKPGSHTLKVQAKGYEPQTVTVKVAGGQQLDEGIALIATTKPDTSNRTEDQAAAGDALISKIADIEGKKITAANPLIQKLPYYGPDYNIDFGVSVTHKGDSEAVAIYITYLTESARLRALDWIRAQGYDPNAYEIIYQKPQE